MTERLALQRRKRRLDVDEQSRSGLTVGPADDPAEREADAIALNVTQAIQRAQNANSPIRSQSDDAHSARIQRSPLAAGIARSTGPETVRRYETPLPPEQWLSSSSSSDLSSSTDSTASDSWQALADDYPLRESGDQLRTPNDGLRVSQDDSIPAAAPQPVDPLFFEKLKAQRVKASNDQFYGGLAREFAALPTHAERTKFLELYNPDELAQIRDAIWRVHPELASAFQAAAADRVEPKAPPAPRPPVKQGMIRSTVGPAEFEGGHNVAAQQGNDFVMAIKERMMGQNGWSQSDVDKWATTVLNDVPVQALNTDEERAQYTAKPGSPWTIGDQDAELDTGNMTTNKAGPGWGIFVMAEDGTFYVGSHKIGLFHHSSFLRGGDVAGAGEIRIQNGRLTGLTNKSGHYKPDGTFLLKTIRELQRRGVSMDGVELRITHPHSPTLSQPITLAELEGDSTRPRTAADAAAPDA